MEVPSDCRVSTIGLMSDYHANALNDALRRVASSPFLAATSDRVADNATAIAAQLQQAVLDEVPAFSKSWTAPRVEP